MTLSTWPRAVFRIFLAVPLLAAVCLSYVPPAVAATPVDVLNGVLRLQAQVEALRVKLGKPANTLPDLPVTGASPREVMFQAERVQDKILLVIRERTGRKPLPLVFIPEGTVKPEHSLRVLTHTEKMLGDALQSLGVTPGAASTATQANPSVVYTAITNLGRQINLLIEDKLTPSDVYQQVERSVVRVRALLAVRAPGTAPGTPSSLDLSRKPGDVYRKLGSVFPDVRALLGEVGIPCMELAPGFEEQVAPQATPSDVYDLASLILTEVNALFFALPQRPLIPGVFYPGPKKPGHVYQMAEQLGQELARLRQASAARAVTPSTP
ncbi:MAG: hypothetical protein H7831_04285 [Magnetococcus sp. WYHC-3]